MLARHRRPVAYRAELNLRRSDGCLVFSVSTSPTTSARVISLHYIYGIGPYLAEELCERTGDRPGQAGPRPDRGRAGQAGRRCSTTSTRSKGSSAARSSRTSPGCATSAATAACGTARGCRSAASGPGPTPGPARARARRSPARRASRNCGNDDRCPPRVAIERWCIKATDGLRPAARCRVAAGESSGWPGASPVETSGSKSRSIGC